MAVQLAPGFLVAAPALRAPLFARSVIVLVEDGSGGALGFIVNRPAPITFRQVAATLELPTARDGAETPVVTGGPVAPESGWILFDPRRVEGDLLEGAVRVSDTLAVSASRHLLAAIARGEGPSRRMLALGYAGWAVGQLEGELSRGIWVPVELDDTIVFDVPPADRWSAALASAGIDPARMVSSGGFSA